jgi:hypothetical protein
MLSLFNSQFKWIICVVKASSKVFNYRYNNSGIHTIIYKKREIESNWS